MSDDYNNFVERMTSFDISLDSEGDFAHRQGPDVVSDILSHYGVKGMKWGVRKDRKKSSVSITDPKTGKTTEVSYNPKKVTVGPDSEGRLAVTGKKRAVAQVQKKIDRTRPVTDDSAKAAEAMRVARNAGVSRLTNSQLQDLNQRLNLEKQFAQLSEQTKSAGANFVDSLLKEQIKATKSGKKGPIDIGLDTGKKIKKILDS